MLFFLVLSLLIGMPEGPAVAGADTRCTTHEEAVAALGPLAGLPPAALPFFRVEDFELKRSPGPHDWLATHPEPGQTFAEYVRSCPNRTSAKRNTIFVQPLGTFSAEGRDVLRAMEAFLKVYFQTDTELLAALPLERGKTVWRKNPHTGRPQVLAGSVMERLLLPHLPPDAFCMLGITPADLYPAPSWNFVFGQASLKGRTGIYSLTRYDPAFYGKRVSAEEREKTLLRRSLKVSAHETGHMFGLNHCVHCECVMNGSNHMEESDARPIFLCPVCLRKLYWNLAFDPGKRYGALHAFFRENGLETESTWYRNRLEKGRGGSAAEQPPGNAREEKP